jgi:hypothetical protein
VPGKSPGEAGADAAADAVTGADAGTGADTDADAVTGADTDADAEDGGAASDAEGPSFVPHPTHARARRPVRKSNPPACLGRRVAITAPWNLSRSIIDCWGPG